jgi:hypothetical protein
MKSSQYLLEPYEVARIETAYETLQRVLDDIQTANGSDDITTLNGDRKTFELKRTKAEILCELLQHAKNTGNLKEDRARFRDYLDKHYQNGYSHPAMKGGISLVFFTLHKSETRTLFENLWEKYGSTPAELNSPVPNASKQKPRPKSHSKVPPPKEEQEDPDFRTGYPRDPKVIRLIDIPTPKTVFLAPLRKLIDDYQRQLVAEIILERGKTPALKHIITRKKAKLVVINELHRLENIAGLDLLIQRYQNADPDGVLRGTRSRLRGLLSELQTAPRATLNSAPCVEAIYHLDYNSCFDEATFNDIEFLRDTLQLEIYALDQQRAKKSLKLRGDELSIDLSSETQDQIDKQERKLAKLQCLAELLRLQNAPAFTEFKRSLATKYPDALKGLGGGRVGTLLAALDQKALRYDEDHPPPPPPRNDDDEMVSKYVPK